MGLGSALWFHFLALPGEWQSQHVALAQGAPLTGFIPRGFWEALRKELCWGHCRALPEEPSCRGLGRCVCVAVCPSLFLRSRLGGTRHLQARCCSQHDPEMPGTESLFSITIVVCQFIF